MQISKINLDDTYYHLKDTLARQDIVAAINKINELESAIFPLTLSVSGGGVFEIGTIQTITVSWILKKGNQPIVADRVVINGSVVLSANKVYHDVTKNTTYKIEVLKGSITKTATISVRFVNPSYLGVVPADFVASENIIKSLSKGISESKARNLIDANLVNQKICYAYPKSFGALSSIKDGNNFEYINSYVKNELAINGELYYLYILKDATSVNSFKQLFY